MSPASKPIAKIGILSIGDMGAGIARLLVAHGFAVASNCTGRSQDTIERARDAGVELLESDEQLVQECPVILSVVPPGDAEATGKRLIQALSTVKPDGHLYFVDLNAIAPSTAKHICGLFQEAQAPVRFIDSSILGKPPSPKPASGPEGGQSDPQAWACPYMPISGPDAFTTLPFRDQLMSTLHMDVISPDVGAASGLKMCFASMTKGFIGIATQSFATAQSLGVADVLREVMATRTPRQLAIAEMMTEMPPKAYRWVREMEEIALTFKEEGAWAHTMFDGAAGIFQEVADDPVLGKEKTGKRKRGTTIVDVATVMSENLHKKKRPSQ